MQSPRHASVVVTTFGQTNHHSHHHHHHHLQAISPSGGEHFGAPVAASQPLPGAYPYPQVHVLGFGHAAHAAHARRIPFRGWTPTDRIYRDMSLYETNPIGALQERFQARGITPVYRVVQAEGASHCPTFSFQVFVEDLVAMGTGNSKKQAKHNAARAMLDKLDGRAPTMDGIAVLPEIAAASAMAVLEDSGGTSAANMMSSELNGSVSALLASTAGNTIGQLQELCVRQGLPMPMYDLLQVEGQPHQRSFQYGVRVGDLKAEGEGTSKKDAKRDAAQAMLKTLRARNTQPSDNVVKVEETNNGTATFSSNVNNSDENDEQDTPINGIGNKTLTSDSSVENVSTKLSTLRIATLTPAHSDQIHRFYARLSESAGEKLVALHRTPLVKKPGSDFVSILTELAKEQLFEVTFVEEEERTDDGHVLALAQLSSLPVAVSCGQGATYELAQQEAALCALSYLKLLTKRSNKE